MGKLLFSLLLSLKAFALPPDRFLLTDHLFIEDILSKKIVNKTFKQHQSSLPKDILLRVLEDPENSVSPPFKIPPYFKKRVIFWAQIYTQFTSDQVLIHDKKNPSIVYDALNNPTSSTKTKIVRKIKHGLLALRKTKYPKSKYAKELRRHLIKIKLKKPKGISREKFFQTLSDNIRIQTGQRDKIFQGILNAHPFEHFIKQLLKHFELPDELLAIAFVESSFNPKATSKVGARGVWQIMPFMEKKLLPEGPGIRSSRNVLLSTMAALHLLAQNIKILKRWDLAVTAYNSGTKYLLRTRKKIKKKKITLAHILENSSETYFGFASKNFFSEFLALVYVLKYKNLLFPIEGLDRESIKKNPKLQYQNINLYISKCGFIPERVYSSLKKSSPHISQINNHLTLTDKIHRRGTLLFSDIPLTPKRYAKLSFEEMRRKYPKNYRHYIKGQKCLGF